MAALLWGALWGTYGILPIIGPVHRAKFRQLCKSFDVSDFQPIVTFLHRRLRDPIAILAYAGWNDAGEAATDATRFLLDALPAEKIATVECEEFLDFTVTRPHLRIDDESRREVLWPNLDFFRLRRPRQPFDLVVGVGAEPHLKWKTHCRCVIDLLKRFDVRSVVLLGSYFDEVVYSQPVPIFGFCSDEDLRIQSGIPDAPLAGPAGIIGVLGDEIMRHGIRVSALWARVPHYVSRVPNVRGTLALLQRLETITGLWFGLDSLSREADEFDREVSEFIAGDPNLSAYVRSLKRRSFQG